MLIFYLARLVLSVLTKGLTSGLLEDRVKAWVCGSLIKILAEWFRLPIHCFPFTLLKKKKNSVLSTLIILSRGFNQPVK